MNHKADNAGDEIPQTQPMEMISKAEVRNQLYGKYHFFSCPDTLTGIYLAKTLVGQEHFSHSIKAAVGLDLDFNASALNIRIGPCIYLSWIIQFGLLAKIWMELPEIDVCAVSSGAASSQIFGLLLFLLNALYPFHELQQSIAIAQIAFQLTYESHTSESIIREEKEHFKILRYEFPEGVKNNVPRKILLAVLAEATVLIAYLIVGGKYVMIQRSVTEAVQASVALYLIQNVDNAIIETICPKFVRRAAEQLVILRPNNNSTQPSENIVIQYFKKMYGFRVTRLPLVFHPRLFLYGTTLSLFAIVAGSCGAFLISIGADTLCVNDQHR